MGVPEAPKELFQAIFDCVGLAEHADTDPRERRALGAAIRHYWRLWSRFMGAKEDE